MAILVTPEIIRAAYDMLVLIPPFNTWGLPPSSEVKFDVSKSRAIYGDYRSAPHLIRVSATTVGTIEPVIRTVAHEIIHLKQNIDGTETRAMHNKVFKTLAADVCRAFTWDEKGF